jgi:bifunctional DNase/RNase
MEKISLNIVALTHSVTQSHNYAVVLEEESGRRRLPIVIGGFEAQAIAVAMEDMVPSRPLTHDLFKSSLDTFSVSLQEVIINNLVDGVFHARLICALGGDVFEIDSRTSDAIAMAVRCDCPIFTYEFIMSSAGVDVDEDEEDQLVEKTSGPSTSPAKKQKKSYKDMSLKDLTAMLEKVISDEDYERAAKIRDEINRRKQMED